MGDTTVMDVIGAMRYTQGTVAKNVAKTTVPGFVFTGGASSTVGSEDWADGVVGVPVLQPVSNNVPFQAQVLLTGPVLQGTV